MIGNRRYAYQNGTVTGWVPSDTPNKLAFSDADTACPEPLSVSFLAVRWEPRCR